MSYFSIKFHLKEINYILYKPMDTIVRFLYQLVVRTFLAINCQLVVRTYFAINCQLVVRTLLAIKCQLVVRTFLTISCQLVVRTFLAIKCQLVVRIFLAMNLVLYNINLIFNQDHVIFMWICSSLTTTTQHCFLNACKCGKISLAGHTGIFLQ